MRALLVDKKEDNSRHEAGRDFIGTGRVRSLPEAALQSVEFTSYECGMFHGYGRYCLIYTTSQVSTNTNQNHLDCLGPLIWLSF